VDVSFEKLETCATWWADFKLTNTSGALFKSISIILTDTDTDPVTVVTLQTNGFTNNDGCSSPATTDTLIAGGTLTASSAQFGYKPTGHTLNAKITICTEKDQSGTCIKHEFNFKP